MKEIKTIIPKHIILSLGILITIVSCNKDVAIIEQEKKETNEIRVEKINIENLKQEKSIFKEISQHLDTSNKVSSRSTKQQDKIVLLTNKILKTTNNDITCYSFLLKKPTSESSDFENLMVFKYPNNKYRYIIVRYKKQSKVNNYSIKGRVIKPSELQKFNFLKFSRRGNDYGIETNDDCIDISHTGCGIRNGENYHTADVCGNGTGTPLTIDLSECFDQTRKIKIDYDEPEIVDHPGDLDDIDYKEQHGPIIGTTVSGSVLDLIFDLDITDNNTIAFLETNSEFVNKSVNFLNSNNHSQEAKNFAKEALKAKEISPNTEIDFKKRVINKLTKKAKCIYKKLMSSSNEFKKIIKKFDGDFSVANLKFEMKNLGTTKRGSTKLPKKIYPDKTSMDFEYLIRIHLNNSSSKNGVKQRPNLLVAKTIAHEILHAEINRKLLRIVSSYDLTINSYTKVQKEKIRKQNKKIKKALETYNYGDIFKYYSVEKKWQHNLMVDKYKETLEKILKAYDKRQHKDQFYEDIAWDGLRKEESDTEFATKWKKLKKKEKTRINKVIKDYKERHQNEECN